MRIYLPWLFSLAVSTSYAQAPTPPQPSAPPSSPPPTASKAAGLSVEELRAEYDAIRTELFRSRARIGFVGEAVFKTKLAVDVVYKAQRDWPLRRLVVLLDDKQVYAENRPSASKPIRAFDTFASAGRHVIAVRIESVGPDNRTGFVLHGSFVVDAIDGKQTSVTVTGDESGDGPERLSKRHGGDYDLRLRANVRSEPLDKVAVSSPKPEKSTAQ